MIFLSFKKGKYSHSQIVVFVQKILQLRLFLSAKNGTQYHSTYSGGHSENLRTR